MRKQCDMLVVNDSKGDNADANDKCPALVLIKMYSTAQMQPRKYVRKYENVLYSLKEHRTE